MECEAGLRLTKGSDADGELGLEALEGGDMIFSGRPPIGSLDF